MNLLFIGKIKLHKYLVKTNLICQGFDGPCFKLGRRLRQNTAYNDDSLNYVIACDTCYEQIESIWEERWKEYWSDRL